MSITTGQEALIRRVVEMDTPPNIVLPNGQSEGKGLPRYVVQASGGGQRPFGVSGTTQSTPEITVRVETKKGAYTTESDALIADLVARFHPGARFDDVEITAAPSVRPPLPATQGAYVVPVVIRGRYVF